MNILKLRELYHNLFMFEEYEKEFGIEFSNKYLLTPLVNGNYGVDLVGFSLLTTGFPLKHKTATKYDFQEYVEQHFGLGFHTKEYLLLFNPAWAYVQDSIPQAIMRVAYLLEGHYIPSDPTVLDTFTKHSSMESIKERLETVSLTIKQTAKRK